MQLVGVEPVGHALLRAGIGRADLLGVLGERVLDGLRRDDLFIFTHREFKEGFAQRCKKMLESFPDEEINVARYEDIKWLTHNPIYED